MNTIKLSKRCFAFLALTSISLAGFAQQAMKYTINGKMVNMPFPEKIYLTGNLNNKTVKDSCVVKDGMYHFNGTTDIQTEIALRAQDVKGAGIHIAPPTITLLVDEGEINIISDGSFVNATLSGSDAQASIDNRLAFKHSKALGDSIMNAARAAMANNQHYDLQQGIDIVYKSFLQEALRFLQANPATPASPSIIAVLASDNISSATIDSLIAILPSGQQVMAKKKIAYALSEKKAAELTRSENNGKVTNGMLAADFTMPDVNGKQVSLSSYRGKYVLVDFWASWCAPCRAENPNVLKAYQRYKDKGFTVLGISLDGQATKEAWIKAIDKDGLAWTQLSDLKGWGNDAAKLYGVTSIPQNFLIEPDGRIVGKNLRGEALEAKLASIFNK